MLILYRMPYLRIVLLLSSQRMMVNAINISRTYIYTRTCVGTSQRIVTIGTVCANIAPSPVICQDENKVGLFAAGAGG